MQSPLSSASTIFPKALPSSRLGKSHPNLQSYLKAVYQHQNPHLPPDGTSNNAPPLIPRPKQKEYSLVVITESQNKQILLGMKNRGFGKGFYNAFGGKIDADDASPAHGAMRELEEETNIAVTLDVVERGYVGVLRFTFEDDDEGEMVVHLFRVDVVCDSCDPVEDGVDANSNISANLEKADNDQKDFDKDKDENTKETQGGAVRIDPRSIRGCDEISPEWFEDWAQIPLGQMFADDSLWLTMLLTSIEKGKHLQFDGWFHYYSGGAEVNTIMHYHIAVHQEAGESSFLEEKKEDLKSTSCEAKQTKMLENGKKGKEDTTESKFTLEKRLFHEIHSNNIHNPTVKEFKECWAVANAVRSYFGNKSFDVVIDVAGGHGALAALFLVLTTAKRATVIDPAAVGGVQNAWRQYIGEKRLRYRYECLRTGLRDELSHLVGSGNGSVDRKRVLVVACHACQHLSDETLQISSSFGVNVAVMPCCQKDHDGSWKAAGKTMGIPIGQLMDLLTAGKMMSWTTGQNIGVRYQVKMKHIDGKITPQNRLILCKAVISDGDVMTTTGKPNQSKVDMAHKRLARAYRRAHHHNIDDDDSNIEKRYANDSVGKWQLCLSSAMIGLFAGILISPLITRQQYR